LPKVHGVANDAANMTNRWAYGSLLVFLLLVAGATQYFVTASEHEAAPTRAMLKDLPEALGAWRQHEAQRLTAGAERELGADDYLSRSYMNERGAVAFVFIAYYASQRQRKTYHSPQNCLPGAGWTLGAHQFHSLNNLPDVINEYVIEKDNEQMLAFYWYHGRGRVVASEYWGRWYTLRDAVTRGRTDGALIRIIVPVSSGANDEQARADGLQFTQLIGPLLARYIPD
jgi:EpsI family protein